MTKSKPKSIGLSHKLPFLEVFVVADLRLDERLSTLLKGSQSLVSSLFLLAEPPLLADDFVLDRLEIRLKPQI